jgi:site-specific DNA recombinase
LSSFKTFSQLWKYASIVQEALEGYAAGRFQSQAEVLRFLESDPVYPKDLPGGKIRMQRVTDLLTRPLYAGYIEVEKWGMPLRKGHHEGLGQKTGASHRTITSSAC